MRGSEAERRRTAAAAEQTTQRPYAAEETKPPASGGTKRKAREVPVAEAPPPAADGAKEDPTEPTDGVPHKWLPVLAIDATGAIPYKPGTLFELKNDNDEGFQGAWFIGASPPPRRRHRRRPWRPSRPDGSVNPDARPPTPVATVYHLVDADSAEVLLDWRPHYPKEAAEVVSLFAPGYSYRPLRQRGPAPVYSEAPKEIWHYDEGDYVDVWWDNIWWEGVVSCVTKPTGKGINPWKRPKITIKFPQISQFSVRAGRLPPPSAAARASTRPAG